MRPDGSHRRNVTRTPNFNEMGGRFSPDGRRLLFRRIPRDVKIQHDRWGALGQLVVARSDGSYPVVYGQAGDFPWAVWSPDGKQVACLARTGIEIRDLASQKLVRTMDRNGIFEQLFWSPDGRWFVGPANHFAESWTVIRVDASSGKANVVAKYQNCTPDFFPDSQRIIFSSRPANQAQVDGGAVAAAVGQRPDYGWTQLWMANGDGSNRSLVYGEDGRHIYGGAVSPDSRYVLFTRSTTDGGMEGATIHLMRLSDAPMIGGDSNALRKLHPNTRNGPVLTLAAGWEPHWTYTSIEGVP
jgi:Tol biopolymer transport system component